MLPFIPFCALTLLTQCLLSALSAVVGDVFGRFRLVVESVAWMNLKKMVVIIIIRANSRIIECAPSTVTSSFMY